jgi:chemotaxis protein histidine kinase CheA
MAKTQIIYPQAMGRKQLDQPIFDADAPARGDDALKAMGASFEQWLDDDILKLQGARQAGALDRWSDVSLDALMRAAHDLKGMGGSCGYPLVTQIAASLCRLIETDAGKAAARNNPALVCAHVDALRAAIRDRIASDEHPVGRALLWALEAEVASLGVAPR